MRVAGIVAEYNPLHNGHLLHMARTRALGASHIVCVLSGDFVQRAEPAVLDKFTRARLAAACGADLVLELPVQYAVGSGERFAQGAVSILEGLGCVDVLSFGSECGDAARLAQAAEAVRDAAVMLRTRALCETGLPYPAARESAVRERCGEETAALLREPNNILGVEYCKAIRALNSKIAPVTVRREGAAHDGSAPDGATASASFLRAHLGQNIAGYIPPQVGEALRAAMETGALSGGWPALERILLYRLRSMGAADFAALPGCADGLGDRLRRAAERAQNAEDLFALAKTKRYTMSRVRRAALAALLGIRDEIYDSPPPYARILAIGAGGGALLNRIKQTAVLPVSHSLARLEALGGTCGETARLSAAAHDLFGLSCGRVPPQGRDYTHKFDGPEKNSR